MGLTSTHWGTYQPKVEQGRITDMLPFSEDGDPSDIGKGFVDVLDAPSRITAPMAVSYTHLTLPTILLV